MDSSGTANNAGAILVLGRDLVVFPKMIHPLPPTAALSATNSDVAQQDPDTWMQVCPTPCFFSTE